LMPAKKVSVITPKRAVPCTTVCRVWIELVMPSKEGLRQCISAVCIYTRIVHWV
jgi:hypothetical protein